MARGSITKRGNNYVIRWRDPGGRQGWKTIGPGKKEAELALTEIMGRIHKGAGRQRNATFGSLAKLWMATVYPNIRQSTYFFYLNIIRQASIFFKGARVRDVSIIDIERYKSDRLASGLSPRSVHHHITILRGFFKAAVKWGYSSANPAQDVAKPRVINKEMRFATAAELARLLGEIPDYYRPAVFLATIKGFRIAELFGITNDSVDLENGIIWIRKSLINGELAELKTQYSRRSVAVGDELISILARHRPPENELNLFFPTETGLPIHFPNFRNRVFGPAVKRAGIGHFRFHDLRHTAVTHMIAAGVNIKAIQRTLGHSSIQTTLDVYGHLLPDTDKETAVLSDQLCVRLCEQMSENKSGIKNKTAAS